jgi:hypothetical protein
MQRLIPSGMACGAAAAACRTPRRQLAARRPWRAARDCRAAAYRAPAEPLRQMSRLRGQGAHKRSWMRSCGQGAVAARAPIILPGSTPPRAPPCSNEALPKVASATCYCAQPQPQPDPGTLALPCSPAAAGAQPGSERRRGWRGARACAARCRSDPGGSVPEQRSNGAQEADAHRPHRSRPLDAGQVQHAGCSRWPAKRAASPASGCFSRALRPW